MGKAKGLSVEKRKAVSRIHWLIKEGKVLRANVVEMKRVCGNKNCRCAKGFLHKSLYLYQSKKGKSRMLFIPAQLEVEAKEWVRRNKEIRKLLDRLSEINWKKIKERESC
jgi:hypothetical protein